VSSVFTAFIARPGYRALDSVVPIRASSSRERCSPRSSSALSAASRWRSQERADRRADATPALPASVRPSWMRRRSPGSPDRSTQAGANQARHQGGRRRQAHAEVLGQRREAAAGVVGHEQQRPQLGDGQRRRDGGTHGLADAVHRARHDLEQPIGAGGQLGSRRRAACRRRGCFSPQIVHVAKYISGGRDRRGAG